MPDVFANITQVPPEMVDVIANVLETRAAVPSQQEMIRSYLGEIEFPEDAKVLEIGCGTGAICRVLATIPNVGEVVGVDPSDRLLSKAEELSSGLDKISYQQGDGKVLKFDDASFDAVILHTVLTHVPGPDEILAEAYRVLASDGWLGVCDGDFATATLRVSSADPLEACCEAFVENFVNDKFLVRKMSSLVQGAGFKVNPLRSYGLVETLSPGLTMSWVDRGADALAQAGTVSTELAETLKAEGRRRAERGDFFGYMAYASLTARKVV
jgi:ubiquinone/menaquinone biosynthesis C-methylase UbiE